MIEKFLKYVSLYNEENDMIRFKKEHSLRVQDLALKIAKEENFSKDECELAEIIGLLHDIGRFEQARKYASFNDSQTIDHAEYGADILFKEGLIEEFVSKKEWYPVIEYSIRNHNKLKLSAVEDGLYLKMGKLIRDVDKLDIIYLLGVLGNYDEREDESIISSEVRKCFWRHECVKSEFVKTNNDKVVAKMLLAFDINFDSCLKPMKEYLEAYYHRVKSSDLFEDLYIEVMKYLDERIDKLC